MVENCQTVDTGRWAQAHEFDEFQDQNVVPWGLESFLVEKLLRPPEPCFRGLSALLPQFLRDFLSIAAPQVTLRVQGLAKLLV